METINNMKKRPDCGRCGEPETAIIAYLDTFICGKCLKECQDILKAKEKEEMVSLKETLGFKNVG